jgi:hypothetical protein
MLAAFRIDELLAQRLEAFERAFLVRPRQRFIREKTISHEKRVSESHKHAHKKVLGRRHVSLSSLRIALCRAAGSDETEVNHPSCSP